MPLIGGCTSLLLLVAAMAMEHVLGMRPCALCMEQRWVHAAVVSACAALLLLPSLVASRLLVAVPLLMCLSIGVAGRHALVEAGLLGASCEAGASASTDVDAIVHGLPLLADPSCADGPLVMGMSIPLLNALASSASLVAMLAVLLKEKFPCQQP